MKAEEAIQISNKNGCTFVEGTTSEHWIRAMQEYARIQIEKDRERVKKALLPTMAFGSATIIDSLPITLD
jgi:hypothetical protein